uniref:BTB domain-containing protein n=1 Tax=Rhabditophanes sp. KR3021 TaxID=114890 RepID=A0AC35UAS6_9BILA
MDNNNYLKIVGDPELCDLELVFADQKVFKTSKYFLACKCDYFYDIIAKDKKIKSISYPQLEIDHFGVYHDWIHNRKTFKISGLASIVSLFNVFRVFKISDVEEQCMIYLTEEASPTHYIYLYEKSKFKELENLNEVIKNLIKDNLEKLVDLNGLDCIDLDLFDELIDAEAIRGMSQEKMFDVVGGWISYDLKGRKHLWSQFASKLDWSLISQNFANNIYREYPSVCENSEMVKFLFDQNCLRQNSFKNIGYNKYAFLGFKNNIYQFNLDNELFESVGEQKNELTRMCPNVINDNIYYLNKTTSNIYWLNLKSGRSDTIKTNDLKIVDTCISMDDKVVAVSTDPFNATVIQSLNLERNDWETMCGWTKNGTNNGYVVIGNCIYITPGTNAKVMYRYDMREKEIRELETIQNGTISPNVVKLDSDILFFGGVSNSYGVSKCYIYDTRANAYEIKSSVPESLTYSGTCLHNDKVYVFGGKNSGDMPTNGIYKYNVTKNSWSLSETKLPVSMSRVEVAI